MFINRLRKWPASHSIWPLSAPVVTFSIVRTFANVFRCCCSGLRVNRTRRVGVAPIARQATTDAVSSAVLSRSSTPQEYAYYICMTIESWIFSLESWILNIESWTRHRESWIVSVTWILNPWILNPMWSQMNPECCVQIVSVCEILESWILSLES